MKKITRREKRKREREKKGKRRLYNRAFMHNILYH